jgi:hypothetical protein
MSATPGLAVDRHLAWGDFTGWNGGAHTAMRPLIGVAVGPRARLSQVLFSHA